jgi:hypothetical protein
MASDSHPENSLIEEQENILTHSNIVEMNSNESLINELVHKTSIEDPVKVNLIESEKTDLIPGVLEIDNRVEFESIQDLKPAEAIECNSIVSPSIEVRAYTFCNESMTNF